MNISQLATRQSVAALVGQQFTLDDQPYGSKTFLVESAGVVMVIDYSRCYRTSFDRPEELGYTPVRFTTVVTGRVLDAKWCGALFGGVPVAKDSGKRFIGGVETVHDLKPFEVRDRQRVRVAM